MQIEDRLGEAIHGMHAWELWKRNRKELARVGIPRCYTQEAVKNVSTIYVQLHHFSEASQETYDIVSYLGFVSEKGLHCPFKCSKAKVVAFATSDHTKLELCAPILLLRWIRRGRLNCDSRKQLWTDMLVLQHASNTKKSFRTFGFAHQRPMKLVLMVARTNSGKPY